MGCPCIEHGTGETQIRYRENLFPEVEGDRELATPGGPLLGGRERAKDRREIPASGIARRSIRLLCLIDDVVVHRR